jgi:hypothetical protein
MFLYGGVKVGVEDFANYSCHASNSLGRAKGAIQLRGKFCTTLRRKPHLYIPRKGIARPQSQFPHSCVCERFVYSQDRFTYFPAAE